MLEQRTEIDTLIASGNASAAYLCLAELWHHQTGLASAAFVVSRCEQLRSKLAFTPHRLAILRSFTVEPVVPLLRASSFLGGIDLTIQVGDFNAFAKEMLDRESPLYRFTPDTVILAVQTADVAPELWQRYADLSADGMEDAVKRVSNIFRDLIRALRERSQAALIVHSLELPSRPSTGLLDAQGEAGQSAAIQEINQEIRRTASQHRGVYLLDYDGLVARHGRLRWHDESKWLIARMPIAADQLIHLSREWLRFLAPLSGKIAKVLVVDLDNVMWGGIIGEDGMSGIKLGAEYPGAAYQAAQRAMLDLYRRGILLAICSKNNAEEALEVLKNHPGMLLRPEHFAAMRINWNDKAQNLREIAADLRIGIDTLAFMDDNPVEREQVRATLPEVTVIALPDNPLEYASALRNCPVFERLALSSEDRERTTYYAAQQEISNTESSFESKEDFYRFLGQEAEIAPLLPTTLSRIAQLTQKTNQFNLTTKRYTEQQIEEIAIRPGWQVLSIRVKDRFGDHGLVGVAITHDRDATCEIDTFLLSCRVIGRTVETAFLSHLAQAAGARGQHRMSGRLCPSKRNTPAQEFYRKHGFQFQCRTGEASLWTLDLEGNSIVCPEWIKLIIYGDNN